MCRERGTARSAGEVASSARRHAPSKSGIRTCSTRRPRRAQFRRGPFVMSGGLARLAEVIVEAVIAVVVVESEAQSVVPTPIRREPAVRRVVAVGRFEARRPKEPRPPRPRDALPGDAICTFLHPLVVGVGVHRNLRAAAAFFFRRIAATLFAKLAVHADESQPMRPDFVFCRGYAVICALYAASLCM